MQITTGKMEVNEVHLYGGKLAEALASGVTNEVTELANCEEIVVDGYDLLFTNMQKDKVKEIMSVLVESAAGLSGQTFKADNCGHEWRFTCLFEKSMEIKSDALMHVLMDVQKIGQTLAEGVGVTYNGANLHGCGKH